MRILRSFIYAWSGLRYSFKTQLNFRIHLAILLLVIVAGTLLKINVTEWLFVVLCSMLVLMLELVNTALEYLCDIVTTDFHPIVKIVKDIAAAAVLISAAGSVITGLIIFLPKIIALFI